ncbi:hypothetical protein, partial [Paenibacillus xylanexedens]|uniref:hypothetical protein n=1 Tax=Paenibacillus xylanexedens TaxID=528191 RepID=UPI001C930EFB
GKVLGVRRNKRGKGVGFEEKVVGLVGKLELVRGIRFGIGEGIGVRGFVEMEEKVGELVTEMEVIKGVMIGGEWKGKEDSGGVLVGEVW